MILAVGILVALGVFFTVPRIVDKRMNGVAAPAPYAASEQARALHERLFVADLHGDTMLWDRDLQRRRDYGHIDLPRLAEGRVSLQVFAAVTKTPRGMNFERNAGDTDNITLLAVASRWPPRTWSSLLQRALYQSEKLHREEAASGGALRIVRSREDLAEFLSSNAPTRPGHGRTAALLALEGLHPLEGKLENVDELYDAGFRMAGLTHFFDNELGGSAHGMEKGGLTPFGRDVVRRLEEKKMLVDLAHAAPKVIDDVLAMAQRPVVISHTGVQATCPGPRNLSDVHIRAIAANGGLIGIGYFAGAVCEENAVAIVKAMRHVVDLVGVRHVALGSDFDGATSTAFDTTGVVLVTQALLGDGFSEADVASIMGGNVQR
ncbi:MAG: dipeptidase, partial [Steroidobacter sp.]